MTNFIPKDARHCSNTYIVNVTPDLARAWLDINNFNRPKNSETVSQYVRQILEARWKMTHQGIAFTKNGFLLDGQHRLFAIIESGVTVPMRVCINESIENYDVIDCGRNRTHLEVIRMGNKDSTISSAHSQTLKAMLAGAGCKTNNRWTNSEIHELYGNHVSPVNFAVDQFHGNKNRQINDPTVRGVIARAYYNVESTALELFCDLLQNGGKHPSSRAIATLEICLASWGDRRENTKREIYRRCELTLQAFLSEKRSVNFTDTIKELFPLPKTS